MLSDLYAAIVRRRREHYSRRPDLRRRLRRPVISVGNLAVGGRLKTPMVAAIARELLRMGERPAILTRGYGRTRPEDGVVIVRDPAGIRSDLARAGDEPLMLARELDRVSVLVSPDRYLAGRLAEHDACACRRSDVSRSRAARKLCWRARGDEARHGHRQRRRAAECRRERP